MNTSHKHGRHAARREKSSGLSTFKKFTVVSVIGIAAAVSMMTAASDSRVAYITDGDDTYTVTTVDTDTNDIIEEAGLQLSFYDQAIVTEESSERIDINIIRAFPITVSYDGSSETVSVTGGTVADALKLANAKVTANDFITPDPSAEVKNGMTIEVVRGVKIYLTYDGNTNLVYVPEGKIGESLKAIGYQLTDDDKISVDENLPVKSGMTVNVDKILYRTTTKKQKIEPKIIEEACDTLAVGEKQVKQEGKEGSLEVTYKEKYVNNVLAEKKEVSTKVITKSVDKIVLVGTKQEQPKQEVKTESEKVTSSETASQSAAINNENGIFADFGTSSAAAASAVTSSRSASSYSDTSSDETDYIESESSEADTDFGSGYDESGVDFSYSRLIIGSCTAYTEPNGITATGTIPKVGTVAVDPNIIPYGTRLYICSADGSYVYGYAIAEDTGSAAMAGDIVADLYMNSEADCVAFGRQELYIYILD